MPVKISALPSASGPIQDDDILILVRDGVTYRIDGDEHGVSGVTSVNGRFGEVVLVSDDILGALQYVPVPSNGTAFRLYGTNASGQQALLAYSQGGDLSLTVAQRTSQGQLDASTVPDNSPQAGGNNLINRAYAQELRADRITTVNSNVSSSTISPEQDGIIVSGLDATNLSITLPSGLIRYKRILIKFRASITNLEILPGEDQNSVLNLIEYSPTSAQAGDLFEWGYDVATSTWLITNYVSFNSLPQ